jgi:FKBP-type peptidyl-prolyl cis-trans isomerase
MLSVVCIALLAVAFALPASAEGPSLTSEDERVTYTMGVLAAHRMNLIALGLDDSELEAMAQGLRDAGANRSLAVSLEDLVPKVRGFQERRAKAVNRAELEASGAFFEEQAGQEGMFKTSSGLLYRDSIVGTGPSPAASDTVRVHYTGTLRDGRTFDSSVARGTPVEFKLEGVIQCWSEGLQTMKVGGKRELVCPASLAYGPRGAPPMIKPGATLVFEVELLGIVE